MRVALIFDDGYKSNVSIALPILSGFGFEATMALEVERVSQDYLDDPALPVVTPADMRTLVDAGWEIANHPALDLNATEDCMASAALTENALLLDLLTGAKVYDSLLGGFVPSTPTNPEHAEYNIVSAVYRGGARNVTSDRAYRTLFDRFRCIPGNTPGGDQASFIGAERQFCCAWALDTSANPLENTLAAVRGAISAGRDIILYAHDTPVAGPTGTIQPPFINADELTRLCQSVRDMGGRICPLRALGSANLVHGPRFGANTAALVAATGDTSTFVSAPVLNSAPRAIQLTATAFRANISATSAGIPLILEPETDYRIRVRYMIDSDLVLNGGAVNRNHGFELMLSSAAADAPRTFISTERTFDRYGSDTGFRVPYEATQGFEEYETVLKNGAGLVVTLVCGIFQATGTVTIGHISVEKA